MAGELVEHNARRATERADEALTTDIVRQQAQQQVESERTILRQADANDLVAWENQYVSRQQEEVARQLDVESITQAAQAIIEGSKLATPRVESISSVAAIDEHTSYGHIGAEALDDFDLGSELSEDEIVTVEANISGVYEVEADTETVTEADANIDVLIADLEAGFERMGAEYVGHLLLEMFLEAEAESPTSVLESPLSMVLLETSDTDESIEKNRNVELFNAYLETLEPTQAEEVRGIVGFLRDEIKSVILNTEITDEEREIIEVGIYALAERLFEVLGIEYDEELIKQFIEVIKNYELIKKIDEEEFSIDYLNSMGTQEYKPLTNGSLAGGLTRLIKRSTLPHQSLGRYTLQACMT